MKPPLFLFAAAFFGADAVFAQNPDADTSVAGNDQVAEIIKHFGGRGALAEDTPPTPAEAAVKQFQVREGFEIELMASEPEVTQPLFATWDSRGRMWVVQYRQYQFPAGLKIVRYDQHLRAVFDKVPEPPPQGPKGADKTKVFEIYAEGGGNTFSLDIDAKGRVFSGTNNGKHARDVLSAGTIRRAAMGKRAGASTVR